MNNPLIHTTPRFVYFDVGGVVIRDFSGTHKWQELKANLGVKPDQDKLFDEIFGEFESEVCIGKDVEAFISIMKSQFGLEIPANYSFLADFVNRFEKNESIWPILHKLKASRKVGLLTNMYPNMLDAIYKAELMPDVKWDIVVDSSIEKVRKPQVEIFQLAQDRSSFRGEEILFVENGAKHIEAAKSFGWQTFLYNSSDVSGSNQKLQALLYLD